MTWLATAFNGGEPVSLGWDGQMVTLVSGATFCLSDHRGDINPGTALGLFSRDARVLSRWQLRIDAQPAEPLAVQGSEPFAAQFILRRAHRLGRDESTVLIVRDRVLGDSLHDRITLENLGHEDTVIVAELHADADFADLFAVKEGRATLGRAEASVLETELLLIDQADSTRRVSVTASMDPIIAPGRLSWRVVVGAGQRWQTDIIARPTTANHRPSVAVTASNGNGVTTGAYRKLHRWRDTTTDVTADDPTLTKILRRTENDLGALLITNGNGESRPFVAAGAPWFMTLYGRDSLLTAWMALPLDVNLALGTLQQLADRQGKRVDPVTEEQPGRILHEIRGGAGGAHHAGGTVYYGSADATPLFVMLLGECFRWGASREAVGALLPAADAALDWADDYGDLDGDGFVEYQRATDRGLINQGWKDSFDGVNDATGHQAEPPIALCEVQGYRYAALLARAELAEAFDDPVTAERLRNEAAVLRDKFLAAFWLSDRGWYAIALDGRKRAVDSLTSNAAHCLWSGIASDEHVETLVEHLAGAEMDSGFGLRTLASTMGSYNPISYHNGSVWPHDTAIAIAGLLRYRHIPAAARLAERLAAGLLDAAEAFDGRLPELFCGFPRTKFHAPVPYPTACAPQAWASAAPLLLVRSLLGLTPNVPQRSLEVVPALPKRWGTVALTELRLGEVTLDIEASGQTATVRRLPDDWQITTVAPAAAVSARAVRGLSGEQPGKHLTQSHRINKEDHA
jgi:glycogen debranching enzyme